MSKTGKDLAMDLLGHYKDTQRSIGDSFERLYRIVYILRSDVGCPWDIEQTLTSLRHDLLEEAYELIEGLLDQDLDMVREESGDLFLLLSMCAVIADQDYGQAHEDAKEGVFIRRALNEVAEKLLRRHPHVFGDTVATNAEEVIRNWDEIKAREKTERLSRLDGIPHSYPPLLRATKLQSRAAKDGFDWPDLDSTRAKLDEEIHELDEELSREPESDRSRVESEIGDILFTVVNIARKLGVSADIALQGANRRFESRYRHMEAGAASRQESLKDLGLEELDRRWDRAKRELENRGV